ncbi:MAG TPA: GNAT family N-acetyltransferase [Rhodanobacteraceae bacterium]|nr:GNAT family N-acetyltransferase [Rhodanobacteraceae bacterium]
MSVHVRHRFTEAPTLETGRLRLRAHQPGDLSEYVLMWADPTVVRYTIGEPSPPQRTWMRLLGHRGHWSVLGFGYWAVEAKETGRYIGELGFGYFKRDLHASVDTVPELGWALVPSAHGKGYATEALRAVLAWGEAHFESDRMVCIIDPGNDVSARVAGKLGFREYTRVANKQGHAKILLERYRG